MHPCIRNIRSVTLERYIIAHVCVAGLFTHRSCDYNALHLQYAPFSGEHGPQFCSSATGVNHREGHPPHRHLPIPTIRWLCRLSLLVCFVCLDSHSVCFDIVISGWLQIFFTLSLYSIPHCRWSHKAFRNQLSSVSYQTVSSPSC
jgi:hypothetical protein